jgi:hypothetical protein
VRLTSLFLDTSIIEHACKKSSLHWPTLRLLELCKPGGKYCAYFSLMSIHELLQKYTNSEVDQIVEVLKDHSVKLLMHYPPRSADYMAINFKYRQNLRLTNEYNFYHLACYVISKVEHYVTWNFTDLINLQVKENLFRDFLSNGYYHRHMNIQDPQFYIGDRSRYHQIQVEDIPSSEPVSINSSSFNSEFIYEEIQNSFSSGTFHSIDVEQESLPLEQYRQDMIVNKWVSDLDGIEFNVRNYEDEIQRGEIPLLRLDGNQAGDTEYNLFKIEITEGAEIVKGLLDESVFRIPLREETDLSPEEYRKLKTKDIFNQLVPLIRERIDYDEKNYAPFEQDDIVAILPVQNLDCELANACLSIKNYYKVKREAIDFLEFMVSHDWSNYRAFKTVKKWISYHDYGDGAVDVRNTVFMIDQEGRNIIIILIHCFID